MQEGGKLFYSIDALFGLCRKRAAGSSVRPPLQEGTFFESQEEVKSYIEGYKSAIPATSQVIQTCTTSESTF